MSVYKHADHIYSDPFILDLRHNINVHENTFITIQKFVHARELNTREKRAFIRDIQRDDHGCDSELIRYLNEFLIFDIIPEDEIRSLFRELHSLQVTYKEYLFQSRSTVDVIVSMQSNSHNTNPLFKMLSPRKTANMNSSIMKSRIDFVSMESEKLFDEIKFLIGKIANTDEDDAHKEQLEIYNIRYRIIKRLISLDFSEFMIERMESTFFDLYSKFHEYEIEIREDGQPDNNECEIYGIDTYYIDPDLSTNTRRMNECSIINTPMIQTFERTAMTSDELEETYIRLKQLSHLIADLRCNIFKSLSMSVAELSLSKLKFVVDPYEFILDGNVGLLEAIRSCNVEVDAQIMEYINTSIKNRLQLYITNEMNSRGLAPGELLEFIEAGTNASLDYNTRDKSPFPDDCYTNNITAQEWVSRSILMQNTISHHDYYTTRTHSEHDIVDFSIVPMEYISEMDLLRRLVRVTIQKLSSAEKRVIISRYGLNSYIQKTLEQIGLELGLTRERVRQIEASAFKSLRNEGKSGLFEWLFDYSEMIYYLNVSSSFMHYIPRLEYGI